MKNLTSKKEKLIKVYSGELSGFMQSEVKSLWEETPGKSYYDFREHMENMVKMYVPVIEVLRRDPSQRNLIEKFEEGVRRYHPSLI